MHLLAASLGLTMITAFATEVTAIEDIQRGQPVTVAGVVDRFHNEDEIQISGFMDNDLFFNELYAREVVTADGQVITVERRYE